MIIRRGSVPAEPVAGSSPHHEHPVARAGGLTHLGANITVLAPGERSAMRHWHEAEDEFLYMLEGEAIVVENDGEHVIGPGDMCCWPAGVPNAHHLINRSAAPVRYLVVGSNPAEDHVHYPDDGRTLHHVPPRWWVEDAEGRMLREGSTD